ncbi:MAG: 6-bladed beta-propeller [Nitrospirae bacterium]|nr:6-bladed beta-propeller [Nitrospirota bacterium]
MNKSKNNIILISAVSLIAIFILGFTFPEQSKKDRAAWPLPPDEPKISYVMTIETPRNVGVKKSIFKRIVEFVVGKEPEPRIQRPFGVLSDGKGSVYVTDTGLQTVHVFDYKNKKYRQIFKLNNEPQPSRLLSPLSVVLDANDRLYVSDSILKKVFVFDNTGNHIFTIGANSEFGRPTGLALDKSRGKLYISDTINHKVWVYDVNPPYSSTDNEKRWSSFGNRGKEDGEFNFPTHLAVDRKGDIYVTDALNFRVQIFNPEGKFITSVGKMGDTLGTFSKPKGLGTDSDGNIYVVDNLYDTIQIFNRSGELLLNFASHGGGKEGLWLPNGLFVDKDNYIFVADTYNDRVQVFRYLQ